MTVTGWVYGQPRDDVVLEIQGRKIGLGECGDFFIFVR
jgi:hypothetical protein